MDSANSGSMQSSDEEYESRGESFTSFLNPICGGGGGGGLFGSVANHHHNNHHNHHQPPLLPQQQQYQSSSSLFNTNSQNLEAAFAQSSNTQKDWGNDDVWSRGLRSQNNHHPNFENFVPLSSSSSSSSSSNQSIFGASQLLNNQPQFATSSSSSTMPLGPLQSHSLERNPPRGGGGGGGSNQNNDHHHQSTAKNPKKRTRASRRAPTTVLNTDTTNFRQMVQEFTGIPAAPFSSSPYSRRLDLFSGGGGGMMGIRSGNLDPLYPLRPSAQKLQMSQFLPQSSSNLLTSTMLEALVSANNASTPTTTNTTPENLLTIHNQILSFQQQQQQPQQPTSLKNTASNMGTKSVTATTVNANVTSSASATNNLRSTTQQQGVPVVTSFDDLGLNHENIVDDINQQLGSNYQFHSDKGLENVQSSSGGGGSGEGTIGQWGLS